MGIHDNRTGTPQRNRKVRLRGDGLLLSQVHSQYPFVKKPFGTGIRKKRMPHMALAKKMLLAQLQSYRQEYGTNGIYLLPVNLYGPRDNFDLNSSHVIPALIRKCFEARQSGSSRIIVWGTGTPTREFLYAEDAAEAISLLPSDTTVRIRSTLALATRSASVNWWVLSQGWWASAVKLNGILHARWSAATLFGHFARLEGIWVAGSSSISRWT